MAVFLPSFAAGTTVDDVAGQFPVCAQTCVKNSLLQKCSQDQTVKCFCTVQTGTPLVDFYTCILQSIGCDLLTVYNIAIQACSAAGYDTSGYSNIYDSFPTTAVVQTTTKGVSVSLPTSGSSPVAGGSTSGPGGSTSESGNQGSSQDSKSSGLSTGAIIGIAVTAVVALGIIAGLIVFIVRNRRTPAAKTPPPPLPAASPPPHPLAPPGYYPNPNKETPLQVPPEQPVYPRDYPAYAATELESAQAVSPPPRGYTPSPYVLPIPELSPPQQLPHELGQVYERQELPAVK